MEDPIECWRKETCQDILKTLPIDETDLKIIQALSENARASNVEIADKIGVSEGTVRRRINEMVKKGIIQGFILLLDCKESEKCIKVFIDMQIEEKHIPEVVNTLKEHERVIALYRTNHTYNILCEAMFLSVIELQEFIDTHIKTDKIKKRKTKIVTGSYKKCTWTGI
ncbi:Winged helix-turn-helix DNA-binding protein [Candidatus Methanoperedenaceae archaeon GB50]|nr:Winged helix-turn-helix DNA-binding protein [Candidatus Methanoperedenaceae archaeon GB50]